MNDATQTDLAALLNAIEDNRGLNTIRALAKTVRAELAARLPGDPLHGFPVVVNPALPPDGWVMVPRELTEEMRDRVKVRAAGHWPGWDAIWEYFLAAAPTASPAAGIDTAGDPPA